MARPMRIEYSGALYHLTSRGNGGDDIFRDDEDRLVFLETLSNSRNRYNCVLHAYCLMSNHFHLLVETPDANVSAFMRHLNSVYTQKFNYHHKRAGHVMQGRFKSILVQKDLYLLELARYIVLNPVRARMVRAAKDWPWSSYRATAGLCEPESMLTIDWILSNFSKRKDRAIEKYRSFVSEGRNQPSPMDNLINQIYLGGAEFIKESKNKCPQDYSLDEIPKVQKRPTAQPIEFYAQSAGDRNQAIICAYASGGYSMREIGEYFGLHLSSIGKIVNSKF